MDQKTLQKMADAPMPRLLVSMGLPVVLSMMLQALYNIVDSGFVSRMRGGEDALHALTLAFPIQMLMVAVSIGTGVGVGVLVSKDLGRGARADASRAAGNGIFLALCITAAFMLFGMCGVRAYIGSQTADNTVFAMGVTYLRICCVGCVGIVFFSIFEKILQAAGMTVHSTAAQITGALVNMILDPVMIYGLGPVPELGVSGAAWATVIGQIASFAVALAFHLAQNRSVDKNIRYLRPQASRILTIYKIGLPAILAQALMSVMTYAVNLLLGSVNAALVTAYGLYYKIQQFILFAAFGLRDTITPIVSFAHGRRDKHRILEGTRWGVGYTLAVMALGTALLELLADPLCAAFSLSGRTQILCVGATRIISAGFLCAGLCIALQGVFQALDCALDSLIVSLCRQTVFTLPLVWIFAQMVRADLSNGSVVWWAFPIAEFASALVALVLLRRIYRSKVKKL